MIPFAVKFVREDSIDQHLALGWMGAKPNAAHHHLEYGIEMKWVCPCPVPGGFRVSNRVPASPTEDAAHERAG